MEIYCKNAWTLRKTGGFCHCAARLQGDWNINIFGYSAAWLRSYSVIFLSSMCPLPPGLMVYHRTYLLSVWAYAVAVWTDGVLFPSVSLYLLTCRLQHSPYFRLFVALLYLGFSQSFMLPTIVSCVDTSRKRIRLS